MANPQQILQQLDAGIRSAHSKIGEVIRSVQSTQGEHALIKQELERQKRDLQNIADAVASVQGSTSVARGLGQSDGQVKVSDNLQEHIMYISQIPGRRVPFDLVANIPIGADIRSLQPTTVPITQDGPFVAVARYAVFQSTHQFTVTDPDTGAVATFQGRSFGRFRPVHSVNDYNDAQAFQPVTGLANPGTGDAIYASPSNHSGFRTMQFDGVIRLLNQGAAYPRSNAEVPSSLWVDEQNGVFQLGALDFFERGEVIQYEATPLHVNNPPAGNVQQFAGTSGVFPALDSQYDVHEGILDPFTGDDVTADPVARLPQGILTIVLHGFRIIQPPGPVRLV